MEDESGKERTMEERSGGNKGGRVAQGGGEG